MIAASAVIVPIVSLVAYIRPTVGHINLLFEPHRITIAVNPDLEWAQRLRSMIPSVISEVLPLAELLLQPHETYLSSDFSGGVDLHQSRSGTWDWAILRAGTKDTCLAKWLPLTMDSIDAALALSGQRVHTAFLSRLGVQRTLPPHCGETRGLFRLILALDGPPGIVARQTVLNDHHACIRRFARPCPTELADMSQADVVGNRTTTVEYAVGDAVLFNDALCHWVEYLGDEPRLALILNVERIDVPRWRRAVLTAISNVYITLKGSKIMGAASAACARLAENGIRETKV